MQTHDTASANNLHKTNCNIHNTISLISWLLKMFAIECNIENFNISSSKLLIRIVVIALFHAVLVSCSLYLKIQYIYESINVSIKYTDAVQTIYDFCQYVVDLYFVYKYGRNIGSEYYKQYDNIDKILNVTTYTTMRRKLMKMTGFFIFIWLISTTCDFIAWVLSYGWIIPLMYSIAYIYLLVKIMTTLDFSTHVMRIELRLQIIGDALQECYTKIECSPHFIGDLICNKNWLYKKTPSKILMTQTNSKCLKILSNNDCNTVQWLTRCYLMITEQVAFINAMYGIRILLNSLSLLIDMVRFTNIAVRVVMGSQHTVYNSGYFPAVSSLMRLLTCAALVISLVIHCEQAYSQRQRILNNIDHILVIKNPCVTQLQGFDPTSIDAVSQHSINLTIIDSRTCDSVKVYTNLATNGVTLSLIEIQGLCEKEHHDQSKELTSALTELRSLVQNRPIVFNVANFFQLKNSILLSIASVVVTYTIILVQSIN